MIKIGCPQVEYRQSLRTIPFIGLQYSSFRVFTTLNLQVKSYENTMIDPIKNMEEKVEMHRKVIYNGKELLEICMNTKPFLRQMEGVND